MNHGNRNKRIRDAAKAKGVYLWQIAYAMGISDQEFSRRLRIELSEADQEEIVAIIDSLAQEGGSQG